MTRTFLAATAATILLACAATVDAATVTFVYQCTDAGASAPGPFCPDAPDGNDSAALVNSILQGLSSPPAPDTVAQFARFNTGGPFIGNTSWFDVDGLGGTSGTFDFLGDDVAGLTYYLTHFTIKAGNGFRLYSIDDGVLPFGVASAADIDWSTVGLANQQGQLQNISHISFYGTVGEDVVVAEPASLLLLGTGLVGLVARRRRQR